MGAKEKAKRLKLSTAKEPALGLGAAEPLPSTLDKSLVFDPNVSWAVVLRRCVTFLLQAQRKQAKGISMTPSLKRIWSLALSCLRAREMIPNALGIFLAFE